MVSMTPPCPTPAPKPASASIQETYAKDFPCLLRLADTLSAKSKAQNAKPMTFFFMSFPVSHSLLFAPCALRFSSLPAFSSHVREPPAENQRFLLPAIPALLRM